MPGVSQRVNDYSCNYPTLVHDNLVLTATNNPERTAQGSDCMSKHSSSSGAAGAAVLLLSGCVTVQAIEPVITPPEQFRFDTLTQVEFVSPALIGWRCAERGAQFMGLPAINSGACANADLITMIDPCQTLTAGPYAENLCRDRKRESAQELFRASVEQRSSDTPRGASWQGQGLAVEFVARDALELACSDADLVGSGERLSCWVGEVLVAANPCERWSAGWYERTLCHELAHANGWASGHDGGVPRVAIRLASGSPQALANKWATAAAQAR